MAYACPVCEALVPDGEHLAHHLAIVAMSRGGEHEAWLEETVPDWLDREPAALGDEVLEHAEEVEHDLVDDPRATDAHGHDRPNVAHEHGRPDAAPDHGQLDPMTGPSDGLAGGPPDGPRGDRSDGPAGSERGGRAGDNRSDGSAGGESSRPADGEPGGQPASGSSIRNAQAPFGGAGDDVSPETAEVLQEARELTEQRLGDAEDDGNRGEDGGDTDRGDADDSPADHGAGDSSSADHGAADGLPTDTDDAAEQPTADTATDETDSDE